MLTWIIIAIAIGVIFGVINFKDLHSKIKILWNNLLPMIQKTLNDTKIKAQKKIDTVTKKDKE